MRQCFVVRIVFNFRLFAARKPGGVEPKLRRRDRKCDESVDDLSSGIKLSRD